METLTISLITKPEHVKESAFVEWLCFEFGILDSMDANNPMACIELGDLIDNVVIT